MPHHSVASPKMPKKVLKILDCAAKHFDLPLNDTIYRGPDTTVNLVGVMLRFLKKRLEFPADNKGVFMKMRVSKIDSSGGHNGNCR